MIICNIDKAITRKFKQLTLACMAATVSTYIHAVPLKKQSFEPTRDQAITTVKIIEELSQRHYLKKNVNDGLSAQILSEYLSNIDPSKDIFIQSDIKEFEQYRYELDDALKRGDLTVGFYIFNRYFERRKAILKEIVESLPIMVAKMDFSKDEYLDLDRETDAWPNTVDESKDLARKKLKAAVLSLRLAGKEENKISELLTKRYKNQLSRLNDINQEDVYQLYMNTLANLYDPHTSYLSPSLSDNFNINMSLSLEGIGAVLQKEDEYTKVVRIVHAGPADKQGQLKPAHKIIGVAQGEKGEMVDVIGWRLDDVVKLIRGPKNSIVRLHVMTEEAKTEADAIEIRITRNKVKLEEQAAQKKILTIPDENGQNKKIGVIDIPAFYIDFEALYRGDRNYKSTTRDVLKLLNELITAEVDGIIIDLRDNGGGSLKEANQLTGLFIEYGPTVQIRNAKNHVEKRQKLPQKASHYRGPLLVMINRLSASASEIFAGALQDYQRAIIVGGQSFGKGTVQSLSPLKQGQLKLTESKFYRISGESTQHRGVVPDIPFPALYDYDEVGESALDGALVWDTIKPAYFRTYYDISSYLPNLKSRHDGRMQHSPDFQYLKKQLALKKTIKDNDLLSLNETKRKSEDQDYKAKMLKLENEKRLAKGEKAIKDLDELTKIAEAESKQAAKSNNEKTEAEKQKEIDDDIFLKEAGQILVDAIPLFSQRYSSLFKGQ